jgi:hypothetical protein
MTNTLQELTPWERNPRTIDEEAKAGLRRSLEEFGDLSSIVFNTRNKRLVGGHQRTSVISEYSTIEIDRRYDPPTATGTTAEGSVVVNGERFKYREVDWTDEKHAAANVTANNQEISGIYTPEINALLQEISQSMPDLAKDLRFDSLLESVSHLIDSPADQDPEQETTYKSQFGVIVICKDEEDQKTVFESLSSQGLQCKVVVT